MHYAYLLQIEYSSLLDVRLLKESVPGAVVSTPSAETCKGGSLTGKTVTLDNNEGNIECQQPGMVANNTKDQESALGTDLAVLFPCRGSLVIQ